MTPAGERPPLLDRVEVVIGNAIPVVGVALLGWQAVTVVFLYVLDVWFCILGLGVSVMLQHRDELRSMVPERYSPLRRVLFWVAVVGLTELILSVFALVPGVGILGHMGRKPADAFEELFHGVSLLVPVLTLVGSHTMRFVRGFRQPEEGVWALPPKLQMMLFTLRMFLMMSLGFLAGPGFLSRLLVPVYVAAIAALFTYSDLYPNRFLARFAVGAGAASGGDGEGAKVAGRRLPKPKLPP